MTVRKIPRRARRMRARAGDIYNRSKRDREKKRDALAREEHRMTKNARYK